MRKFVAGLLAAAFALSLAGAADACPFMGTDSKDTKKETVGT